MQSRYSLNFVREMPFTVKTPESKKLLAELSVPSKTFLLGEYLILLGGPALIVSTAPRFQLRVFESERTRHSFHPKSPAGTLIRQREVKKKYFEFIDPYCGAGGMGASSAQFVMIDSLLNSYSSENWRSLYANFRALDSHQEFWCRPSGGDVVAQFNGGISYFEPNLNKLSKKNWKFEDLDFSLFKTPQKLATHEHLKNVKGPLVELQKTEAFDLAKESLSQAAVALEKSQSAKFVTAFQSYSSILEKLGLVSLMTLKLIQELKSWPEVLAAKGCGAMGADVICVLHKSDIALRVQEKALKLGLKYLGSSNQIETNGLVRKI